MLRFRVTRSERNRELQSWPAPKRAGADPLGPMVHRQLSPNLRVRHEQLGHNGPCLAHDHQCGRAGGLGGMGGASRDTDPELPG